MKKILLVFGTRPEAIKMAPVALSLAKQASSVDVQVCVTAQHREMLDQVLAFFGITPRFDLNLMEHGQSLNQLTAKIVNEMGNVLGTYRPDVVLVHGDTTTSMAASLASYYARVPVGHIEAGLRTYQRYAPFPEEINRQLTGRIATYHFAPTEGAKANLLSEGVSPSSIFVTGNTVVDACQWAQQALGHYTDNEIDRLSHLLAKDKKCILITAHRRENQERGMRNICEALLRLATRPDVQMVFPVHRNPAVRRVVDALLNDVPNITLIEPLGYPAFVWLMLRSHCIISDSGGIQEEATVMGKPVLVMRDVSERPEAIDSGLVRLVGTDSERIYQAVTELLDGNESLHRVAANAGIYGDGSSAERIADIVINL